mgnify:CR=1 FL=1
MLGCYCNERGPAQEKVMAVTLSHKRISIRVVARRIGLLRVLFELKYGII